MDTIYLDHNSTTPIHPAVTQAITECFSAGFANPASAHAAGRQARRRLEEARERIGTFLGADVDSSNADQIVFTSGGTEANNLALRGMAGDPPGRIIISSIEHPSIVGAADALAADGFEVVRLNVDVDGVVSSEQLPGLLTGDTRLVSVMLGNNETGVLQPVAKLSKICQSHGVPLHTDAVQVCGKMPIDFQKLGVTALTASAHKLHGPRGIGLLIARRDATIRPILFGGFQQFGVRPGTESIALAVGFQRALELWQAESTERRARMTRLRNRLETRLREGCSLTVVNGAAATRLPHTSNVAFPGLDRQALLMALDQAGVACSTGSACASGSSEPSPVLLAMGCPKPIVEGALRLSLGATTTETDVERAAERILSVVRNLAQVVGL